MKAFLVLVGCTVLLTGCGATTDPCSYALVLSSSPATGTADHMVAAPGNQQQNDKKTAAYTFWDNQIKQACTAQKGTPYAHGGSGTEDCNKKFTAPVFPAHGAPQLTNCTTAETWAATNPFEHMQDLNWIQAYNGASCGYYVSYQNASDTWMFRFGACNGNPDYVKAICNHAAAY